MELDKKLEAMLKKKIALEKLKLEEETVRSWQEKVDQCLKRNKDYRSLEVNLKALLHTMDNRLHIIRTEMKELM